MYHLNDLFNESDANKGKNFKLYINMNLSTRELNVDKSLINPIIKTLESNQT